MTFSESLEQETSLPSFFVTRAVMWAVCALHAPNLREPHPTKLSDCAPSCPACLFCGGAAMWDARLRACLEDGSTWGEPAALSLALLLRGYTEGNCSGINHLSRPQYGGNWKRGCVRCLFKLKTCSLCFLFCRL